MKTLTSALKKVMEDIYAEATPKASAAMFYVLSDLTRTPNQFKTPYFVSKYFNNLYKCNAKYNTKSFELCC